jgi:hypothetical protein
MQTYEITYAVLPAGIGPDDYEPADLEVRRGLFEFPDPGPDDRYELNGQQHTYGPPVPVLQAEVAKTLQPGEQPIIDIRKLRKVD